MSEEVQELRVLKTIMPSQCPHCGKDIFVGYSMMPPAMTSVLTPEDIAKAKEEFINRIEDIKFKDVDPNGESESKKGITKWINDENTLFSMVDVDDMVKNVLTDNT